MNQRIKKEIVKLVGFSLLLIILTGCVGAFAGNEVSSITSNSVNATMQYLEEGDLGPKYDVVMDVPQDWVGQFDLRNIGNRIYFDYTGGSQASQLFFIEALSADQYWKQSGSYPGSYVNIVNKGDTYFIYHLPIDTHYSGLDDTQFENFSAAVPTIVESFSAQAQ